MSDEQRPDDRAPRPGAGDAARTQQIPRLGRDGKPAGSQRTVADALREARQSATDSSSSGGRQTRPAGPARPATGGSRPAQGSSAGPRDKAAPGTNGAPAKPAAAKDAPAPSSSSKPAPAKAAPSNPSKTASSKAAPAKDQKPASPGSTASKAPAARPTQGGAQRKPDAPRSATPTAADYARTTRQSADTTAVIPAVKDDAPATSKPAAVAAPAPATPASASGRQARLRLTHVEPWSVTRLAFVVSVALMIVSVVAVTIFWIVLDLTGIWDQLNGTVTNVLSDSEGSFDLTDYLGLGRLVGLTLVFSAINVVLMTAIATIAAHLYNLAAQLLGGIEVTFSDD